MVIILNATTDLNGQRTEYAYDDLGRLSTVRAPYEIEGGQNHVGERIVKSHRDLEGVYVNGAPQGITRWLSPTSGCASSKQVSLFCIRLALKFHETEDYTIYPAPIITVTKNRFTKHYFIGDKRIASKLGTGKFNNVYGISGNNVTAGQKDYAARMLEIEKQREEYYKSLGTPPGVPTMKGATADPDNTSRGYNDIIINLGDHSVPEGWVQRPKFNDKGDVPGPPIQWQKPEDPDNAQPGYGYISTDTTNVEDIFFYHSDHLGSTSYITDAKANITQFDAYLPYGELLVDEHSSSEEMPYKFNGKEFDQETGLYYYGARYMNPLTSLWYGVDPLAEKYPNIGVYVYCYGNPVKFVDPNGMDWEDIYGNKITNHSKIRVYIFYDPKAFSNQSRAMYNKAEKLYGKGSVALSDVTTEKGFVQDWQNMKSSKITEVNLNYHGSNQALHLDATKGEYITSTGNGKTNSLHAEDRVGAVNVQNLPRPLGNIRNAQLNINSCKSNSITQKPLLGSGKTLMRTFADTFNFQAVRGSSVGVSYGRFDRMPHPKYISSEGWFKDWEYIGNPIYKPASQQINTIDAMYYKTGGMK